MSAETGNSGHHTLKVTIEPMSRPWPNFLCHEPSDAECRQYCVNGCEERSVADCRSAGHQIKLGGCSYVEWMDADSNSLEELYQGPKTELRSGPVEFTWHGDYYTWRYAPVCCVCDKPIRDERWIGHQRLGVRWHASHGVNERIRGEDVSGHTLLWGGVR